MGNLDSMKAGIGPAVVIGITFTAIAGYTLFTMLDGIDGLTVVPKLPMSVLFGGLIVAAAASVRRVALEPRTCV